VADLRIFGTVQAEDAMISIVLKVNGKALSSDSEPQQRDAPIVLSPAVPHPFYRISPRLLPATPRRAKLIS
jgi:hypothetical protein